MTIEALPFEHRPRNSIANNLDKINELVDWVNLDTHLYASATGERVTVDDASSFKGLTIDGRSLQDGTPTPDAPVPVQVVEGPLSLVIGDASVAIDLQGNKLASLPDGTRDELHVDSVGAVTLTKRVGYVKFSELTWNHSSTDVSGTYRNYTTSLASLIKPTPTQSTPSTAICSAYPTIANSGNNSTYKRTTGVSVGTNSNVYCYDPDYTASDGYLQFIIDKANEVFVYPLITEQTINLGYIDPPAIPSGSVVTVSASLTPTIHLDWWVDDGITELVNDLIAYVNYKTEG